MTTNTTDSREPRPLTAEEEAMMRGAFEYAVEIGTDDEPAMGVGTALRLFATLDAAREQAAAEARRELDETRLAKALAEAEGWPLTAAKLVATRVAREWRLIEEQP